MISQTTTRLILSIFINWARRHAVNLPALRELLLELATVPGNQSWTASIARLASLLDSEYIRSA